MKRALLLHNSCSGDDDLSSLRNEVLPGCLELRSNLPGSKRLATTWIERSGCCVSIGQWLREKHKERTTQEAGDISHSRRADDRNAAWYTAFYFLAEHVRQATDGAINYKQLYALVGSKGRYINHTNPTVRKRTAGTLSRIIHTKRYVEDMQNAYGEDSSVFNCAAENVCACIRDRRSNSEFDVSRWIVDVCWPDVRAGLVNEAGEWRRELDLFRLDYEMSMLFGSCRSGEDAVDDGCEALLASFDGKSAAKRAESMLSALFHAIAFGCLETGVARALVDGRRLDATPGERCLDASSTEGCSGVDGTRACLIRFANSRRAVLSGFWTVSKDEPFEIGRYSDCSAIELSGEVSRVHCRIKWERESWFIEDAGSRNGGKVYRSGTCVCEARGGADATFPLEFGDVIELPDGSTYLFAAMGDSCQVAL